MLVADVPKLIPYFATVARKLARGPDREDLVSAALLAVVADLDKLNRFADPLAAVKRRGVWAMLNERRRQRLRAARHAPLGDVEPATAEDHDHFEELIQGDDAHLLRLRYGVGRTLAEMAGAEGVTPAAMKRMVAKAVGRVGMK